MSGSEIGDAARGNRAPADAQFALACESHRRGDVAAAAEGYRRAIAIDPRHAASHCNLALAYGSLGQAGEAVASGRNAVALAPDSAAARNALGLALQSIGDASGAEAEFRQALAIEPTDVSAWCNLGTVHGERAEYGLAENCFRRAVELRGDLAPPRINLGSALLAQGRMDDAIDALEDALRIDAANGQAWGLSGLAHGACGRTAEAVERASRGVALCPAAAEAHHRLGVVLRQAARLDQSAAALREAVRLRPAFADALVDLGVTLDQAGRHSEAVAACRAAIAAKPDHPVAHCALAVALSQLGEADEALAEAARATDLKPDYEEAQSTRLFLLNYSASRSAQDVDAAHRAWARARAPACARPAVRHSDPERRLRIGYVSPDLRQHSVAFFLAPVLEGHDRRLYEVVCYSDVLAPDRATRELRAYADLWRDTAGLTDAKLADLVRQDAVDVLVDLAVHSGGNRLLAFARRPAPVQVTWLGYAGTTGLQAIDYKLTDPILDPPGSEAWHAESLWRLPDCYFCYTPPPESPAVVPLPRRESGGAVLGAFQNLAKVTPETLRLWAGALRATPEATLVVKARGLGETEVAGRVARAFAAEGVEPARVRLEDWEGMAGYLRRLGEVDVMLDTVPFNGGTTTLHALWMGVPTVTLVGDRALARMGASILHNVGLDECAASSPEGFSLAVSILARDRGRLARLRDELRDRLTASPLMDRGRFVRHLEAAYREMWRRQCEKAPG